MIDEKVLIAKLRERIAEFEKESESEDTRWEELMLRLADEDQAIIEIVEGMVIER